MSNTRWKTSPDYANVTWGSLLTRKIENLQRLQNRAQSIIKSARLIDNWSCDWLNVNNLISFDRLVMTYKIMNKLSPECHWDKFELSRRTQNMQQGAAMIFKSQD